MKKILLALCMSVSFATMFGETPIIEEAFVAFATSNYFPCIKILLESVKAFSTRKIVVFGLNADVPFSTDEYPCLIKKRIDVDLEQVSAYHWKPRVLLECGVKYAIYIDADLILNAGVDSLFELCREAKQFPICPIHPNDPNDQGNLMKALGVAKKSMPYVHNDQIIFSEECRPFIEEWLFTGITYQHLAPRHDEKVLNVLLWKHGATRYAESTDPYFESVNDYVAGKLPGKNCYMFHGCKNMSRARKVLDLLIAYHQKNLSAS